MTEAETSVDHDLQKLVDHLGIEKRDSQSAETVLRSFVNESIAVNTQKVLAGALDVYCIGDDCSAQILEKIVAVCSPGILRQVIPKELAQAFVMLMKARCQANQIEVISERIANCSETSVRPSAQQFPNLVGLVPRPKR